MDEPVVDTVLCRLFVNSTKMAATTASMRIRPAIAMPMAKLLCDMQKLFGSSTVWNELENSDSWENFKKREYKKLMNFLGKVLPLNHNCFSSLGKLLKEYRSYPFSEHVVGEVRLGSNVWRFVHVQTAVNLDSSRRPSVQPLHAFHRIVVDSVPASSGYRITRRWLQHNEGSLFGIFPNNERLRV